MYRVVVFACVCVMSGDCGADLEAEECGHAERGGLSPPHTHLGPAAGAGAAPLCAQPSVRTTSQTGGIPPYHTTTD